MALERTVAEADAASQTRRWAALVGAVALGLSLVAIAGFAGPQALHDLAHDGRHALTFPCH